MAAGGLKTPLRRGDRSVVVLLGRQILRKAQDDAFEAPSVPPMVRLKPDPRNVVRRGQMARRMAGATRMVAMKMMKPRRLEVMTCASANTAREYAG